MTDISQLALSILTAVPLFGAVMVMVLNPGCRHYSKRWSLGFSLVATFGALLIWYGFEPGKEGFQFEEEYLWLKNPVVYYHLGVDGISIVFLLLTALIIPFSIALSKSPDSNPNLYFSLLLLLQCGLTGTFTALNFFHWFLFWEASLIPAFFLVRLWGGRQRAATAGTFFVFTMVGSIAMLVSFLALYFALGTFEFNELAEFGRQGLLTEAISQHVEIAGLSANKLSVLVFSGVFLGVAVKIPLVPFHSWLPDTYTQAPTPVTIVLTGVMSKMGVYGMIRLLLPIFPGQIRILQDVLLGLAVLTIVYGAFAALQQTDLKKMLAYSSINHLGYCALGIFASVTVVGTEVHWITEKASALNGVVLQCFSHGITASALFFMVWILESRKGAGRKLGGFSGLRSKAPVFCGLCGVAAFASLGLPGLSSFVGEFLIFKGAFSLAPTAALHSIPGLLVTAVFLLRFFQITFCGPCPAESNHFADLNS
jgi:NADH-quinone oxidoreductase subunit M